MKNMLNLQNIWIRSKLKNRRAMAQDFFCPEENPAIVCLHKAFITMSDSDIAFARLQGDKMLSKDNIAHAVKDLNKNIDWFQRNKFDILERQKLLSHES
jgi:hypothetical protein